MICIIPTLMVLAFFFNSRILQTGILQTGPNQIVENQNQNQDNTRRFGMKNLPKRLELFLAETSLPYGAGTFRHQPFGRQKFLPISATIMSPKCPVKHVHIPLVI